MKRAVLIAFLLASPAAAQDRAEELCRQAIANGVERNLAECVSGYRRDIETLSRYSPPAAQAPSGGFYSQPVPGTDAPPLQNILPPTVRCQSVSAGLGTIQTVCR